MTNASVTFLSFLDPNWPVPGSLETGDHYLGHVWLCKPTTYMGGESGTVKG